MSEQAILAEELVVSVLMEIDGKEILIPLDEWLDSQKSK
jgi:hypothetical protein